MYSSGGGVGRTGTVDRARGDCRFGHYRPEIAGDRRSVTVTGAEAASPGCQSAVGFVSSSAPLTPEEKRTQELYVEALKGSSVVCFDEFGSVEVRPQPGRVWALQNRPICHWATYSRTHGVRYFLGAYDVHADCLWMHSKQRKRLIAVLVFLKVLRRWYDNGRKIHLVLDNASSHHTSEVVHWCRQNNSDILYKWERVNASIPPVARRGR